MSVAQIAAYLRKEYPAKDGLTDFNPFFERVATLVKRLKASRPGALLLDGGPQRVPGTAAVAKDS